MTTMMEIFMMYNLQRGDDEHDCEVHPRRHIKVVAAEVVGEMPNDDADERWHETS